MKGKTLEVVEYNLTFGQATRKVNVYSLFKYKKNQNVYVIYADVNTKYELIYYGGSHIKNTTILSMECKIEDSEIIKEYIYKLTNNQPLEDFEIINIEEATGIEIVTSKKLEIKLEIIRQLEDLTIEKPKIEEITEEQVKPPKDKKKTRRKILKILLILLTILSIGGGTFYLTTTYNNTIAKRITCKKIYQHSKLKATVEEINTYNFLMNDILKDIDTTNIYTFNSKRQYENFINSGNIYKYPEENPASSYEQNEENKTIKYQSKQFIDSSYTKPTKYEELITYYINNGYNCSEKIEK